MQALSKAAGSHLDNPTQAQRKVDDGLQCCVRQALEPRLAPERQALLDNAVHVRCAGTDVSLHTRLRSTHHMGQRN